MIGVIWKDIHRVIERYVKLHRNGIGYVVRRSRRVVTQDEESHAENRAGDICGNADADTGVFETHDEGTAPEGDQEEEYRRPEARCNRSEE